MAKSKIYDVTATGSTTPRDIRDRFADVINVRDFGAKGDGDIKYTDNTISRPQVLIVAGQSNAAGYAPNLSNRTDYPLTEDMKGKGFYWDGDLASWVPMTRDASEAGMFVWHQYTSSLNRTRYGFVPFLVQALINATDQPIYVINVAKGATSLNHQYPGTGGDWTSQGSVRSAAKQIVDAAMAALPVQADVLGTVWLQGEDDASGINNGEYTIAAYKTELFSFIEWAKTSFGGKFGVCTIAYNSNTDRDTAVDAVNLALRAAPREIEDCYLLSTVTRDFREQGHMMSDGLHYLASGHKILGRDIAHKLLWLTNAMSWEVTGTDDTAAIQAALDAGINGKVIFPKGTYLITSPLKVGYSYLDLGEARLVWAKGRIGATEFNRHHDYSDHYADVENMGGVMKKDIDLYGGVFYGDVMLDVRHRTLDGYGARCVIEGGVIDGGMTADVGIRIHAYHTLVHGVEVRNVYQTGIALSPHAVDGGLYSSQVMVSDSTLVQYRDPLQSVNRHTIGIYVQDLDNHIDNCNICWFGSGICMRSSGNVISNTHITEEAAKQIDIDSETYMTDGYGNFLDTYPECTNVLLHPCADSVSGVNIFSNMYFNAGKYVIYSKTAYTGDPGRMNTDIHNSTYLLKSARLVKGTEGHDTFLFGGENGGHLHVQGFNAYSPSVNRFRDYFPSARLEMRHFTNSIQIMNHGEMNSSELITANNWHNKGATHCVAHADYPIPANTYARIGAIMCKLTPSTTSETSGLVTGPITVQLVNRGYWTVSRTLNYSPVANVWTVEERSGGLGSVPENTELFIDNTRQFITLNGMTYVYFNLYLGSANGISGGLYLQLDDTADLYKIYIYAKPNNGGEDVITEKPSNITQILQIGA